MICGNIKTIHPECWGKQSGRETDPRQGGLEVKRQVMDNLKFRFAKQKPWQQGEEYGFRPLLCQILVWLHGL